MDKKLTLYSVTPIEEVYSVNFETTCYLCKKKQAIGRVEINSHKKEVSVYRAMDSHECKFASKQVDCNN